MRNLYISPASCREGVPRQAKPLGSLLLRGWDRVWRISASISCYIHNILLHRWYSYLFCYIDNIHTYSATFIYIDDIHTYPIPTLDFMCQQRKEEKERKKSKLSTKLFVTLQRWMKTILRSVGQFVHQLDVPISGDSIFTINSGVIYGKSQVLCFPHNIVKQRIFYITQCLFLKY